jgi:hypothetical protein
MGPSRNSLPRRSGGPLPNESVLVADYGLEPVTEWLGAGRVDDLAERRRANLVATLALGGEVG